MTVLKKCRKCELPWFIRSKLACPTPLTRRKYHFVPSANNSKIHHLYVLFLSGHFGSKGNFWNRMHQYHYFIGRKCLFLGLIVVCTWKNKIFNIICIQWLMILKYAMHVLWISYLILLFSYVQGKRTFINIKHFTDSPLGNHRKRINKIQGTLYKRLECVY